MNFKKVMIIAIILILLFLIGFYMGKKTYEVKNIFNIEQWEIDTFSIETLPNEYTVIYKSNGLGYITNDQQDSWDLVLSEITIVGRKRYSTKGTTAHTKYKIEMKNGDIYIIEWLGCLNQVDITYPNGKTEHFFAYYQR